MGLVYDPKRPTSYILYVEANNLFGWAADPRQQISGPFYGGELSAISISLSRMSQESVLLESIKHDCCSASGSSVYNAEEVTDTPIVGVVLVSGSIRTVGLRCCIYKVISLEI